MLYSVNYFFSFQSWKLKIIFTTFAKILKLDLTKKQLIDLYALVYKSENIPPIGGRILGLFFVSNQKYFTFEELMEELSISKSATSKALKFLIEIGDVSFIKSKENKRKRLFFIDINGVRERMNKMMEAYKLQVELMEKTLAFRDETNTEINNYLNEFISSSKEIIKVLENQLNKQLIH